MSKIILTYPPGATPLDPDEKAGLIPDYISTQGELNSLEKQNITEAVNWLQSKTHEEVLSATFIFELHIRMLGDVWKWAGQVRKSNKNIGIPKEQVMNQLAVLLEDTKYWIKHKTYKWDELAARFHHRLVHIHIFSNGNGRHARLTTDVLLEVNGQEPFTWGMNSGADPIEVEGQIRESYVSALKKGDAGDYGPLIKFVKT